MRKFVFETHIPAWSDPITLNERMVLWKKAGLTSIMLQVDDGHGATWDSSICPTDQRIDIKSNALKSAIASIHGNGMQAILCLNVVGIFAPPALIKPEFSLSGSPLMYDVWNPLFVEWRSDYIAECAKTVVADGIALDYIRSGRERINETMTASEAVFSLLTKIRQKTDQYTTLMNVTNSVNNTQKVQGIDVQRWYDSGLIDWSCFFNYIDPFPVERTASLPQSKMWYLAGNYDVVNGVAIPRSQESVSRTLRRIIRRTNPASVGVYNANQFNEDHASSFSQLTYQL